MVSGSSNSSELVRVSEQVPVAGKGIENLLMLIKTVHERLRASGCFPQKFIVEVGKPLRVDFLQPRAEVMEPPLTFNHAIRTRALDEYVGDKKELPWQQLFNMFRQVTDNGLFVNYVVVGNRERLRKWTGMKLKDTQLFGVAVAQDGELPDDVVLVCGTDEREAYGPSDIRYTIKGVME